jgi:RimJ/RimL family protein N-acetyltransferase
LSVLGEGTGRPWPTLTTPRLELRRWREDDRESFAALNADPAVMEHFPGTLTRRESVELVEKIEAGFEANRFGLWALEVRASGEFIGFTGLDVPGFEADFMPAVEVGWRLGRSAWRNGYATEAARAAVSFGFEEVGLGEIVSFTTVANRRSRAVMERLGMSHDPGDDFEHPGLPPGHPQRSHVLYRLESPD